jgi:hypothetical protein
MAGMIRAETAVPVAAPAMLRRERVIRHPVVHPQPTSGDSGFSYDPVQRMTDALSGSQRDAFIALNGLFTSYGLSSLAPKIFSYIQNGYSADTISILLQQTTEYKTRFAGNELRKKAGLAVLSPADYLNTEASYRQILASAGLPASFYDTPSDFATWIGGDVSPTEIKSRVDLATAATTAADPFLKQQLQAFYGVDSGQLAAYFLDQSRALPLLQKQEAAAAFGAEAARRGLTTDANRMMDYVNQGFSQSQASQGFQQVADELPNLQALASRFGVTFGQQAEEQAVFGTSAAGVQARQGLINSERALFSSNSGSAAAGLSAGYRAT